MKKLFFISLFIFVASCSDSKNSGGGIPGAGLPELTIEQKLQVSQFNGAIDDISVVTDDPSQQPTNNFGNFGLNQVKAGTDTLTKAQQELVEKMDWAKQNNHCQVSSPNPPQMPQPDDMMSAQEAILVIGGSQCPMTYKSQIKTTPVQSGNGYSVTIVTNEKFVANPQGAVHLGLDIQSFDSLSKTTMSFTAVSQGNLSLAMNLSAKMTAQSLSVGPVVMDLAARVAGNVKINPQTGEVMSQTMTLAFTATQTYQDFKVVAHMTASETMSGPSLSKSSMPVKSPGGSNSLPFTNAKFFINGKSVSEKEFSEVFPGIGLDLGQEL